MKVYAMQGDTLDAAFAPGITGALRAWSRRCCKANPGLSELGVILPHGTAVDLPDVESPTAETLNLWD